MANISAHHNSYKQKKETLQAARMVFPIIDRNCFEWQKIVGRCAAGRRLRPTGGRRSTTAGAGRPGESDKEGYISRVSFA
jgi:hypothetical protein